MTLIGSLSGSVSFVNTLPVSGVSSGVVIVSFSTFGGSFTEVTVMAKVAESDPPFPSEIV